MSYTKNSYWGWNEGILYSAREALQARLDGLGHPYHNAEHSRLVSCLVRDLLEKISGNVVISPQKKVLLEEAALRHDDAHSGKAVRSDGRSNELVAVYRMREDFDAEGKECLPSWMTAFMEYLILGTSDDPVVFQRNRIMDSRRSSADLACLDILRFADVGYFSLGMEAYLEWSLLYSEESRKHIIPEEFIGSNIRFLDKTVEPRLLALRPILRESYFDSLTGVFREVRTGMEALRKECPDRENLISRPDIISGRIP